MKILPRVVEKLPKTVEKDYLAIGLVRMIGRTGQYVQLPWGVCSTTLGSTFNYPQEYFQLPWGVFSTTLGSIFNYLGEYVQLPWEYFQLSWGVFSTILGSMFSYPGENVQLPWGESSTTLGSIFNYPEEYVSTSLRSKITKIFKKSENRTVLSRKNQKNMARERFEATKLREGCT